ncbi:MarR family winged helix-turn-helix transcriptional regulator [Ensifer adhaerens]|uniref:MarR family winged helix-turn-helix transcriptional regulator n=1 Tax=Ensifer adhaerens TaxID=106592 RepID=UPI0011781859|nr:MarR family transcriptional regulator [Ensifer adhaerens]
MEDVVRQLGYLCLGSRLKRIAERLQADVTRFGEGVGFDVPAGQYPVLAALDRHGALSVGDLVQALGVSQPGVTRSLTLLAEKGLIEIERNERDRRQKAVVLSSEGRNIVERSKRDVWRHVETAVTGLCAGLSGSLLDQLDAIEAGLDEMSLDRRALEKRECQCG